MKKVNLEFYIMEQKIKDYEVKTDAEVDPEFLDEYKKVSHENNILPNQAQKMFNWYMNDRTRGVWERKALLKAIRLGWSGLKKAPDQDVIDAWQEWHSYGVPTRTKGN